jgi:predicted nucleotidyltransferase
MDFRSIAENNLIFECTTGSVAYGTSVEGSDVDTRGIFIGSPINIITPFYPVEQVEGPGDKVIYEFGKFMKLVVDQNPNILELLWAPLPTVMTPWMLCIGDIRSQLLSTKSRHTFTGYAHSQLKRLQNAANSITESGPRAGRNEKRALLEAQFGYDTKHAMHLIRLLRMGIEILRDHTVVVRRPDAEELLDIRNGKFTLEQIIEMAADLDNTCQTMPSELPRAVDLAYVAEFTSDMYLDYWTNK